MKHIATVLGGVHAANWLSLAAAPTFALMAVLAEAAQGGAQETCAMHMSLASGMVPMYTLMSAFHFGPWLKFLARWRDGARAA